jgi:valyl-tRNA synthetase
MQKIEQELARARTKLGNDNFVRNAPPEVVVQERERLADFERRRHSLVQQIEQVRRLL